MSEMCRVAVLVSLSLPLTVGAATDVITPTLSTETRLGPAPVVPDRMPLKSWNTPELAAFSAGGFGTLDLSDRHLSRAFHNLIYTASEGTDMAWTGAVATCTPGTRSQAFKVAVLTRVQYFRAMAGVPSDTTFNATYLSKAQEAALMMSANDDLDHSPPPTWDCYTADGAQAAGSSNLSYGNYGWNAVYSQMRDNGSGNGAAGHRRWILYPQTQEMGTGDIPSGGGYASTNALWVFDGNYLGTRPTVRDTYVAWPPPGYVPYDVVFPRWSFSYPGANFSGATVSMTKDGIPVPIVTETVVNGYGEPTIVWVPDGLNANSYSTSWPQPAGDTTYTVTLGNISAGGGTIQETYDVTVFDPSVPGADEVSPEVIGSTDVTVGVAEPYTYDLIGDWVGDYELRETRLAAYSDIEGAEFGLGGIVDGTDASYDLITSGTRASGTYSFHMAQPSAQDQYFTLPQSLLIGSASMLRFSSRLGYATTTQVAKAQISLDDGASWSDVYTQAGTGGAGEGGFTPRSLSLAAYQDRTAIFRFYYEFQGGSYFYQTSTGVGFYVDDIEITDSYEVTDEIITDIGSDGAFDFTAAEADTFGLQVRGVPWPGFGGLEWSSLFMLEAVEGMACSGDVLVLMEPSYTSGTTECTATISIENGVNVTVGTGAKLLLTAPSVQLNPRFKVAMGGRLVIRN
ncbi:MAG: CAP domain-containing protein [Chromatiaceae bacterium]|nr:CAP domain-containing protein [Chromatiaceae bacterium]